MGEIVDIRPDRFLRELREHGNVDEACAISNLTRIEIATMCQFDPKFDVSQIECYLEFMEEAMLTEVQVTLGRVRVAALKSLRVRHPTIAIAIEGA